MPNIKNLPYLQIKNTPRHIYLAQFLLKKIKKQLRLNNPYHYLIFHQPSKILKIIQKLSRKYPYFLRFDIEKYYPSIDKEILISILFNFVRSKKGKKLIEKEIIPYLNKYQIFKKGLPLGNFLAYVLAGFYLFPLDFKIIKTKRPFLRVQDDYLIFLKTKKEPLRFLKEVVEPILLNLKINLNPKKITSGKFHQDKLNFLGYTYIAGIFKIEEEKIITFKETIKKLTHLTRKKELKAIIKGINRKILGFGHYYKFCQGSQVFKDLDAFIRQRIRRYVLRNKNQKEKFGNLVIKNSDLKLWGLKSLKEIYEKYQKKLNKKNKIKYGVKNKVIFQNYLERKNKIEKQETIKFYLENQKTLEKIYLKNILDKIEKMNKKLEKLEKLIQKQEKND